MVSLLGLLGETVLVDFDPGEDGPEGAGDGLDGGVDEAVPDPAEAVDAEVEEAQGRAAAPHVEHGHHAARGKETQC